MASLIPKNGVLLNYAAQAPSPSKDYCQLYVTLEQVIFRWWKITLRSDAKVYPGEIKDSYEDFIYDDRTHSEINRVFGRNMMTYVKALAEGHIDYLPRLSHPLLLKIIRFLDLEDIAQLSQVSKQFREICQSDELWEQIYSSSSETPVTDELRSLADAVGWRKLFFTNKLQLQVQLRRQARKKEQTQDSADDDAFIEEIEDFDTETLVKERSFLKHE